MKAITYRQYGGPDQLTYGDQPDPVAAPGEVLVEVRAVGVNPAEFQFAAGEGDGLFVTHFPVIPGWDVAGVVRAVGPDAEEYQVGDEVIGYVRKDYLEHGTYAELVSAHVRFLAPKPRHATFTEAAGLPLAGLTAYQSLERARVTAGDTVLIHAAAGGVGSLGVQLAAARGARVIGTASARNHDFVASLGGEPVTYGDGLVERVRALAPDGVSAVLDFVGGGVAGASLELLADPTRLVSIVPDEAVASGGQNLWVRADSADLTELSRLVDTGQLRVPLDQVLPLERAADAWVYQQSGRTRGKNVLTVEPPAAAQ